MVLGRAYLWGPLHFLLAALRTPLPGLALVLCAGLLLVPAASAQSTAAPNITSVGPFSVAEGDTAVATLAATDDDTAAGDLTWRTTGGADQAKFSLSATGVLTFTAARDFESPDDADMDGSYLVTVEVSDGTNTDSADLVVTLTDVAEPPSITSVGPFSVAEGDTAVATLAATDDDTAAGDLEWTKTGGADQDKFALTAAGVLTFTAARDFENPDDADMDGSYLVTVEVSDGTSTDSADLVVTLTNVTELAATITGPSSVSFAENSAARVGTFSASSDADRDGVTWVISGTDSAHFTLDSATGALRFSIDPVSPQIFVAPPDYESPDDDGGDNVYSIALLAIAGSETTTALPVTVTVRDVDEPGEVTLSSTKPGVGTQLTATLSDPDGVTAGTASWQWERNDGREGWLTIAGATSASYTPKTADGDRYLRVRVTYTDGFGAGKTAEAIVPNVVILHRLSALTVGGLTAVTHDERVFYPAFDPDTLHYAARCSDSMTLTLTAQSNSTRVAVSGVQRPQGSPISLGGLAPESDIQIRLTGDAGGSTTYFVHCLEREQFPKLTTVKATGALEDLLMFSTRKNTLPTWLIMMDNNGVPRLRHRVEDIIGAYFRAHPDESGPRARYSYTKRGSSYAQHGVEMVVLDRYFNLVSDEIHIKNPFNSTDAHDQQVTPGGDYVLIAYSSHQRDLRFLQTAYPDIRNEEGDMLGSTEPVRDGVIQVQNPDGTVVFNWTSWDHMAIEDCISSRFRAEYTHINSLGLVDGDIIAGFRHCSRILRIDGDTGEVVWRAGPSILTREQWEAGETLQTDRGPAPLDFVNDPRGGFSGQHGGHMTSEGTLLVYDNATNCVRPPGVPADAEGVTGCSGERTRAVEYALDTANGEIVFLREVIMPATDPPRTDGGAGGHAEPMDNGDWLVSWSNTILSGAPMPSTAVHVDPGTGTTKLTMTQHLPSGPFAGTPNRGRVTVISPVALAARNEPLTATLPPSSSTSVFHTGATDSPQVVVAFSRPVVDFDETSPSLSVTGGTVAGVSAHVVAGEPANAYFVTLTPDGDGAITFSLVVDEACADGGICAADGTLLTRAPATLVIGPAPSVSFEHGSLSVTEGPSQTVAVQLSAAHQGVRGVTVPIVLDTSGSGSADDLTAGDAVTFEAGETRKTFEVRAPYDDLAEGDETATLTFGVLPDGLSAGTNATSTVTIADDGRATIDFTVSTTTVPEGGEGRLDFTITNGLTFELDQTIALTLSGTATPGDDFELVDAGNVVLSAPYTLTFPAGADVASATLRIVDDADVEETTETIVVSASLDLASVSPGTRTVEIPPSDVPGTPVVTIVAGSAVTEGADATFTLSRTTATNLPLSEPLTVSAEISATGSTLIGPTRATASFEANSPTATLEVSTLDDRVVERAGTVTALLRGSTASPPLYLAGRPNSATVTVNDNDTAAFTIAAGEPEVAEGGAVTVTITADGVTFAEPQEVALTLGGTATPGEDFTLASSGQALSEPFVVTLPAHATSVAVTINTPRDDEDDVGETIEVTASHDGSAIGTLTLTITEAPAPAPVISLGGGGGFGGGGGGPSGPSPSDIDFEWTVKHDLEALDDANDAPTGLWSDGATLWVADNPDGAGDGVYAYDLETGERIEEREFPLDERNRAPRASWAGETTMWIADSGRDKLFAYDLKTGERLEERDIVLAERNADARGIWSDGTTMWVLDGGMDALFAYDLATGEPLAEYALDSRNRDPHGLWSDRVTVWVSDAGSSPRQLFAYRVPTLPDTLPEEALELERVREEDFAELSQASNNSPRGIWSDGDVMYVADASDGKVYTYNMPDAIDARLTSLTLSGIEIGEFDPGRTDYEGVISEGVTETTVTAEAVQRRTGVAVAPPDADEEADGHQVSLNGVTEITVTVTSADGTRTEDYRVRFSTPQVKVALEPGWNSLEWPGPEGASVAEALEEAGLANNVVAVYWWDEAAGTWQGYFPGLDGISGLNTLAELVSGQMYWIAVTEPVTWVVEPSWVPEATATGVGGDG